MMPILFLCVTYMVVTALRTFGRNRRDKHFTDLQLKVLDKLGTGSDVMAFVGSEAYQKMMTSTDSAGTGTGSRVLNTIQAGMVLLSLGLGMMVVANFSGL